MATFTIDTHKLIQNLQSKGFTAEQAEGIIETLVESRLVSVDALDQRLSALETRLYRAMLIQTGAIAAIVIGILQLQIA